MRTPRLLTRTSLARIVGALALGASLFCGTAAIAQTLPATAPELKAMRLEAGTWDADITFPSREAGKPDGKAKGVQVNTLKSGGMWIVNEFQVEGTPYQGTGLWGYDPKQGKYIGIWADNNEHRIRRDLGTWDEATQTMTWTAELHQADGSIAPLRFTEKFEGEKRTFHMIAIGPKTGKEVPLLHIVFTRRPGTAPQG
ncbi:MAG TPA: DUF1579 family protein [Azospirillaceae bacterium]|nr:DUF1579 family protein [Azospirillaceae bacterium]